MNHRLALTSVDGTLDVDGPVRVICACGFKSEPLRTPDEVGDAAEAHVDDVVAGWVTEFEVFAERDHVERDR